MEFLLLFVGLAILLVSGDLLVRGGVGLANNFKISRLVIGVTVVSFGTSAPELIVSVNAAISGHPEISIGNVIGSNIANIALILGITAVLLPIPVNRTSIVVDWPVMMFASLLFWWFANTSGILQSFEGIIFVVLLIAYIIYSIKKSKEPEFKDETKKSYSLLLSIGFILASSVGLYFGSDLLVNNAVTIATNLDVSEHIISVTIIAFGTSVPELATSIIAVYKKETDISIGNIIGSNIFNLFAILGITSIIKEIPVSINVLNNDIFWMLGIAAVLFLFIIPPKRGLLKRWKGACLLLIYFVYIYLLF
ncbi:MAG: calcium/sodium antiporter [Bacteroidales bacterium]|nr:calcium/sodium antiporter [Bacteroidales bacterium]